MFRYIRSATGIAVAVALVVAVTSSALGQTPRSKSGPVVVTASGTVKSSSGKTTHTTIVVNSKGKPVYWLSGDSAKHPECTSSNGCLSSWPAVKTTSSHPSVGTGVKGTVGVWKRKGFWQVTINGHPLYTFSEDTQKNVANGQGLQSFGGTWGVQTPTGKKIAASTGGTGSTGNTGTHYGYTSNTGNTGTGTTGSGW